MAAHILVIDDEPAVRDAFVLALEDTGHRVEVAADGLEGTARAEAERPDLVFLDLKMPGMDGIEAFHRLRALDRGLPIVIVTAFHPSYLEALETLSAGKAVFHLAGKPLNGDQIRAITAQVLAAPE